MRWSAVLGPRYAAVGAESYRMAPLRIGTAVAADVLLGAAVGWTQALAWAGAVAVFEAWSLVASRPLEKWPVVGRGWLVSFFWANMGGSLLWSGYGLILWLSPNPVCHIAAIAFWAGHMIYAQYFYLKSLTSMLQTALITAIAPIAIPLLIPRFQGLDQLILLSILGLCVGHAINGARMNILAARTLEATQKRLVAAKEEAEAATQAKSSFLAIMSHEIRTPLNGVLGMTQAMAMQPLSPAQRERLDVVRQSGEALLAILNDVLDLSKIEAGKLTLESIDFDLGEVIQGAYQAFTALANKKGLSFSLDIADAEGTYRGDPTRIRQILYNLISNALKFTSQGEIRVRAEPAPQGLRLIVSDTGEGIAPDKLASLFAKFTQADASTTRRFGGTGLGLSICRDLAELMGGTIEAQSRPGAGSTFIVNLATPRLGEPRPAAVLPSPVTPTATALGARALRVLAAEDNQVNQLVLKTLLHHAGVEPVVVENGALAVEAWESGEWDLILMDVQMPVMDGPQAARAIRAREVQTGRRRTPIIALTANAMAHQVAEYLAGGMDGHVAKPIEAKALFEALVQFSADASADAADNERGALQSAG